MPSQGNAMSAEAEDVFLTVLQSAASADGPGAYADVAGLAGPITLEIVNTGAGASSLTLEGSFDGINWYACGYAQLDNQSNPQRAVGGISIGAAPFAHVYSVLDTYTRLRSRMSGTTGSPSITAALRGLPV